MKKALFILTALLSATGSSVANQMHEMELTLRKVSDLVSEHSLTLMKIEQKITELKKQKEDLFQEQKVRFIADCLDKGTRHNFQKM